MLQRLEVATPGGGYILSSACSVASTVEPARIECMSRLARERGRYFCYRVATISLGLSGSQPVSSSPSFFD